MTTFAVTASTQVTIQASYNGVTISPKINVTPRVAVRGVAGDLWADIIIGKPNFGEITPNQMSANRVFNTGGVTVDTSVRPNRVYMYDGTNSRILGLSHLGTCAGGPNAGQACTTNSDCPGSACALQQPATADLVLGQPSFNTSACNGDSSYQNYPSQRPPAPPPSAECLRIRSRS